MYISDQPLDRDSEEVFWFWEFHRFQNETYCSKTDTHNTLLYGSNYRSWAGFQHPGSFLWTESSIAMSVSCFLSELMLFGNITWSFRYVLYLMVTSYVNHSSTQDGICGIVDT